MAGHRTITGRIAGGRHQFRLRVLLEMTTVCCIVAAAQQLNHLLGIALSFGVIAAWAIRVQDWRMQTSLVTLFGGLASVALGFYFVAEGFRLIPEVLNQHCLPDLLLTMGPLCVMMGGFWASFGLVHLIFTLVSADSI